ncbi:MAG: single-stranded DNA-binding protein [Bacteroidales bacterium]|nr:single-stranded DNA-binding protein [Bacteroidales bacterium]
MSLNKVILVGNVGKDPVVRYFDKGVAKATFPLATSESYTNQQGETVTTTEWHNIVVWRALAEVAEKHVKKGTQLYVTGKIKTRSYVDKDGNNKYITEILADAMYIIDRRQGTSASSTDNSGYPDAQSSNNRSDRNYPAQGKAADTLNEPGKGNDPFNEDIGAGAPEDDLPF